MVPEIEIKVSESGSLIEIGSIGFQFRENQYCYLFIYLSIYFFICLFVYFIYLFIYLFICLFIHLFIYSFILFIYLFIYQFILFIKHLFSHINLSKAMLKFGDIEVGKQNFYLNKSSVF